LATIFCYIVFLVKNNMQRDEIEQKIQDLEEVGTQQQKEYEETVISYQKKINDFVDIFENHEFASNVFYFMQSQTMPNIWFSRFDLDRKNSKVQLLGGADNMEDFSRQVATFEKNEYIKSVGALNSILSESAKVQFNINLIVDPELFSYFEKSSRASLLQDSKTEIESLIGNMVDSDYFVTGSDSVIVRLSNKKMITIFDFPLSPEVIGDIDQESHTIKLDVPYGTDITKLTPFIVISPDATVIPGSYVAQDFTNPVVYRLAAEDGSTQEYRVTVSVLPQGGETKSVSGLGTFLIIFGVVLFIVSSFLAAFFILKKRLKAKKLNGEEKINEN